MKFTGTVLFVSVAYLASRVSSAPTKDSIVSITSPIPFSTYKAGSEVTIIWTDPTVKDITVISLYKGSTDSSSYFLYITGNIPAQDLKYVWEIPIGIEDGDDYFFELGDSYGNAYAGPFSIKGSNGSNGSQANGDFF